MSLKRRGNLTFLMDPARQAANGGGRGENTIKAGLDMRKTWKKSLAFLLAGALLAAALTGCSGSRKNQETGDVLQIDTAMYSADYWLAKGKNTDKVLASSSEITQLNLQTTMNVENAVDLVTYPSELSMSALNEYLGEYQFPDFDLYAADGTLLYEAPQVTYDEEGNEETTGGSAYFDAIQENMNLNGISPTNRVSYALTLLNTSARRFPTGDRVFVSPDERQEDFFLQCPLVIGEPVVVLHTSADQTWYYVQLRSCRGWVYWSDLVFLEKSAWVSYIESTDFIVVTEPSISVTPGDAANSRTNLYMGTVLPLYDDPPAEVGGQSTQGCYVVRVPAKDRFGNLEYAPMLIPMNSGVSHGYLPYTPANVLRTAMKLAGEKLRTRGLSYGWDGDRFLSSVYRVFGINLPFTVAEQKDMQCNDSDVSGMTAKEKTSYMDGLTPGSLLYTASSAMIYLGKVGDNYYILHPAASFFVDDARYTANSILITRMDVVQEGGLSYYDAVTLGRVFAPTK